MRRHLQIVINHQYEYPALDSAAMRLAVAWALDLKARGFMNDMVVEMSFFEYLAPTIKDTDHWETDVVRAKRDLRSLFHQLEILEGLSTFD
ncbi:hypothetical protein [Lacticaseibacillus brantae]|uniref:Uncharacterized protein n=1 Tax=Lacticaseibacillus brantae DSM 23927 TaxID=1423727 RepID=A0A0R2B7Z6_9LACO|nr:hypothetical protein [Lacticaseibacillus brantae]KRM71731.1 hypothetical protein FC34_GL001390 [Lacticaseibacillus brantae DSM 23927]